MIYAAQSATQCDHSAKGDFDFVFHGALNRERLLHLDLYSAGTAFMRHEFDIRGDFISAVKFLRSSSAALAEKHSWAELLRRAQFWFLKSTARLADPAENIRFHYDLSNDFYRTFLDARMVYSCAYFSEPDMILEEAQLTKMDHICRKLQVARGDSFLDIGSGWGALPLYAACRYRARATGCTLSEAQFEYAQRQKDQTQTPVEFLICDYSDLTGKYNKIASVGMFEHAGKRLHDYFKKVASLLELGGLFLNHGIVRRHGVELGAESVFLQKHVFPGYEIVHLSEVIAHAEQAGLEVLDVENLRPHCVLTCREWVRRMRDSEEKCISLVGDSVYRAWQLYLTAAALSFENEEMDVQQVLFRKSGPGPRPMTRTYMYASPH